MLYSSDYRRRPPANNRTCDAGVADLRRSGHYSSDFRSRLRIAVWQVGFSGEGLRHYLLYSSDFRRRSTAKNQTCDARWGASITGVADLRQKVFSLRLPHPAPRRTPFLRSRSRPPHPAPVPLPLPRPLFPPPAPPEAHPKPRAILIQNTCLYFAGRVSIFVIYNNATNSNL